MNVHALALISAVVSGALGQLFMKQGMTEFVCVSGQCSIASLLQQHSGMIYLFVGIGFYIVATFLWIFALKKYPLNYAYPMLACGYVIVYLGAALPPLSEALTTQKTLGVLLILAGVTLSAQQKNPEDRRDEDG